MTENELRARVCAQARSWLGRREADGSHREIIDVYNQIVPRPRDYRMTYTDPWCATFVSAVGQACGLTATIFPECGCGPMIELYKKAGRWMEDDAYLPAPADVIFYDWQDSGQGDNRGAPDHVGLVLEVAGDLITVIEGNCANQVAARTLFRDNRFIRGYGLPDYAAAAIVLSADEGLEDTVIANQSEDWCGNPSSPPADDAPVSVPDTAVPTCTVTLPVLMIGDKGEAVRAAQLLLKGRGFSVGWMGADGELGDRTQSAVGKFQRDRGIETDGVIGPVTWKKLICDEI